MPTKTNRPNKSLMRAGIAVLAGGFVLALTCAILLGANIPSVEPVASAAHEFSKLVLLIGLIILLVGYRNPKEMLQSIRRLGSPLPETGSGRFAQLSHALPPSRPADDSSGRIAQPRPGPSPKRAKLFARGVSVAVVLSALLAIFGFYAYALADATALGLLFLALIWGVMLVVAAIFGYLTCFGSGVARAFGQAALLPFAVGVALIFPRMFLLLAAQVVRGSGYPDPLALAMMAAVVIAGSLLIGTISAAVYAVIATGVDPRHRE